MTQPIELSVASVLRQPAASRPPTDWSALTDGALAQSRRRDRRQRLGVVLTFVTALAVTGAYLFNKFGPSDTVAAGADAVDLGSPNPSLAVPHVTDILPEVAGTVLPRLAIVVLIAIALVALISWLRRKRIDRPLGRLRKAALALAGTIVVLLATWTWAFDLWLLPSSSMTPTLLAESRVWVDATDRTADRGDIIVHDDTVRVRASPKRYFVRRVIAVGGDAVAWRDGTVYVNGTSSEWPGSRTLPITQFADVTLGQDELFVVGDNYRQSFDSRNFGPIKAEQVHGTVRAVIWSPDRNN